MIFGDGIFRSVGAPVPAWYLRLKESQTMYMLAVYFIGSSIASNLLNTGAFEVTLNGEPVWSKLESGRMPDWNELMQALNTHGLPLPPGQVGEGPSLSLSFPFPSSVLGFLAVVASVPLNLSSFISSPGAVLSLPICCHGRCCIPPSPAVSSQSLRHRALLGPGPRSA